LHNFGAEVGAANGSQVLLVAFGVARVLVQQEGGPRFDLRVDNRHPQVLRPHRLACHPGALVLLVPRVKDNSVKIDEVGAIRRAKERPRFTRFDAPHEKIRNPECVEKIASSQFLRAVIFFEVEKRFDVRVPRLEVGCERSLALPSALVDVPRRRLKATQHGDDSSANAPSGCDTAPGGAHVAQTEADPPGALGDDGTALLRFVDAFDGVLRDGE
jgi:hypothetical protein